MVGIDSAPQQVIDLGDRAVDPLRHVAGRVAQAAMVPLDLAERRIQPIAFSAQHVDVAREIIALGGERGERPLVIRRRPRPDLHQAVRESVLKPSQRFCQMLLGRLKLRHAGLPFDQDKATI
jgi:hypothetical protein